MENNSSSLGFGGFLLGLGIGWFVFTSLEVSLNLLLFLTSGFTLISDFPGFGEISGDYKAEDILIFTGTAVQDRVYFECDNFNGPITVSAWTKNEYDVSLKIKAKGRTVQAAENLIDGLDIELIEEQVSGQLRLVLVYDIPSNQRSQLSIEVTVNIPSNAEIGLQLESSNGGITLSDIKGSGIILATSNGGLTFENVYVDSIDASTSNGRIQGTFEAPIGVFSTSNGGIDVTIPGNISAEYTFGTSNGGVDVTVIKTTDIGFDLDVTSSNGDIDINVPNLDYSADTKNRKVAKTENYDLKNVKIAITISTSNGNVDLQS
jgi:DUF4097 and DUF4098 domain-containing protein YvlB